MSLSTYLIEDPGEILKFLPIGTKIPVWYKFHKYILHDLNFFKAKSILLCEEGNPTGHVLVFSDGSDILYFGFFGVIDDNNEYIEFLINQLIIYAKNANFNRIIGPINIPTILYGWGFMERNSLSTLYIGKPINPFNYNNLFLKNSFQIKSIQYTWEGNLPKTFIEKLQKYEFEDYESFKPNDLEELKSLEKIMVRLNKENMPSQSVITPRVNELIDNYINFALDFGGIYLFTFAKCKSTNEIVAYMASLPNPFRKNKQGIYDSFSPFIILVDKKHRKKGLSWFLIREVVAEASQRGIQYFSTPLASTQKISLGLGEKLGLKTSRKHIIYEYVLDGD